MIIFFDPKTGRGGGQVVLEDLADRLLAHGPVGLVMPETGRRAITISDDVIHWATPGSFVGSPPPGPLVLVSNANASLLSVWRAAAALTRQGMEVRTVAIVHNYPSSAGKHVATASLLGRMDQAIVVEPGLCRLRSDSVVPAWLSVTQRSSPGDHPGGIARTGRVKSYARPDPSKGMHLLEPIFRTLTAAGIHCEVALGDALDGQVRYERALHDRLAPWLVEGRRTADWIEAGDIFVVPSVSGEAACLAAQEAMSSGAFVVASRLGLMPYLSPENAGVRTFPVGDHHAALASITKVRALAPEDFSRACLHNVATIAGRAGRWEREVIDLLLDAEGHGRRDPRSGAEPAS